MDIARLVKDEIRRFRDKGMVYKFNRKASDKSIETLEKSLEKRLQKEHKDMLRTYNGFSIRFGESIFKLLSTKEIPKYIGKDNKGKIPIILVDDQVYSYDEFGGISALEIFKDGFREFIRKVEEAINPFYKLVGLKSGTYKGSGNVVLPEGLESLESLVIETDEAKFVGISNLRNLKKLRIIARDIDERIIYEIQSLENLKKLSLSSENLHELNLEPLKNLKNLKKLVLRFPNYSYPSMEFLNGLNLEELVIEGIKSIDIFKGISTKLRILKVRKIEHIVFSEIPESLRNLVEFSVEDALNMLSGEMMDISRTNWKVLRIKSGNMQPFPQKILLPKTMRILKLTNLDMEEPPEIEGENLLELDMSKNKLGTFNYKNLKNLRDLDLSDNLIRDASWVCNLRNLEILILNNNLIEVFSPKCYLHNLYRLELKGNPIKFIDRKKLPNINVLYR